MPLLPTGYVTLTWNESSSNIEGYYVQVYKNSGHFSTETAYTNSISISGLLEGDSVFGYVYNFKGDNIDSDFQTTSIETVPISEFDQTFSFNSLTIEGSNVDITGNSNIYHASFNYKNESSNIVFDLINPRDGQVLNSFNSEPLLKRISTSHGYDNNILNSFVFTSTNLDKIDRTYYSNITVTDYHDNESILYINLINDPISIDGFSVDSQLSDDSQAVFNFNLTYSNTCDFIEYFIYENNEQTGQYLESGRSLNTNNFSINLGDSFSGSIQFIPNDWFGTGLSYVYDNIFFETFSYQENVFNSFSTSIIAASQESYGSASIYATHENLSSSGSYFKLSIDKTPYNSYNQDSYFTGIFSDLSDGYSFDYFSFLDKSGESNQQLYINIFLHQSGTNTQEDSVQLTGSFDLPYLFNGSTNFDYVSGITSLGFNSFPDYTYTGIKVYVSGYNDTDYSEYIGDPFYHSNLESEFKVKIVDTINESIVYDELLLAETGLAARISLEDLNNDLVDVLYSPRIYNELSLEGVEINRVRCFGRFSFLELTGDNFGFSSTLSGYDYKYQEILDFEDFINYEISPVALGFNNLNAPKGLSRNKQYIVGSNEAGYESGLYYMYRFLPENGYGTGIITDPVNIEFNLRAFTEYVDGNQQNSDGLIDQLRVDVDYLNQSERQFTGLLDSPSNYLDNHYLKSSSSDIFYQSIPNLKLDIINEGLDFIELSNTPSVYSSGKYLKSTDSGIFFESTSGLARDIINHGITFTGLTDTPSGYEQDGLLVSSNSSIDYLNISSLSDSFNYGGILSNDTAQGLILNTGQIINYDMVSGNKIVINNANSTGNINLNVNNLSRSLIQVFDFDLYSYNLDSIKYTGIDINLTAENQPVNTLNSGNFLRSNYNTVNIKLMNLDGSWQAIKTYY